MESVVTKPWVKRVAPFGSRVVGCATEDSDYDFLLLVCFRPSSYDMVGTGFTPDSTDPLYGEDFSSWRKGNVNLVFTESDQFFNASLEATEFCKKHKIFDKQARCKIHESFRANTLAGSMVQQQPKPKSRQTEIKSDVNQSPINLEGFDPVDKPLHYNQGGIECIDYIRQVLGEEGFKSYCLGNTIKYVHRHTYKGKPLEDLKKAKYYLDKAISTLEEEE